jgi:transcription-repair coupling factor (superfamily II helicase)
MRDRFGPLPPPVVSLCRSVHLKLLASEAQVTSVALGPDQLVVRAGPTGVFDRASLYRRFRMEARISTNVLRIPRSQLGRDWLSAVEEILRDMVQLRQTALQPEPAASAPATTYAGISEP